MPSPENNSMQGEHLWMPVPDPVMAEVQSHNRGCVAIVTGASKGLGREITLELLRRRVSVIAVARTASKLQELRSEALTAARGHAWYIQCPADVTTDHGIREIEASLSQSGLVLIALVNNAGTINPVASIAKTPMKEWRHQFETNLFSVVDMCQRFLPTLRATRGRIINISSGAAARPYYGWSAYCSSKAALNMVTQSLAAEVPEVMSIAIRPGVMDTDMQEFVREKCREGMKASEHDKFVKMHSEDKLLDPTIPAYVIARIALEGSRDMSGKFYSWDDPQLDRFRSRQDNAYSPTLGSLGVSLVSQTILPPELLFNHPH
ncbi:hypothetical protein H4R18_001653 [Coemansia javaensis]|uniref:Sepiapterin reductase n=1 Tax=Coemansia javaensis TaxID=2761396 RepID=A0A9W8LL85_9FUNG|nr:hypothetical protein H4R18_001653 [Coemansia javaensis]